MRRWLAIFLLVLLPAQLGWAAVGVYCAHESGAAADHFGHHAHRHTEDDKGKEHIDQRIDEIAKTGLQHMAVIDGPYIREPVSPDEKTRKKQVHHGPRRSENSPDLFPSSLNPYDNP